jgi:4-oxalocrotonate tautomerase
MSRCSLDAIDSGRLGSEPAKSPIRLGGEGMPFVNIRLVKEVIADDPEGKKAAISKSVTQAIRDATGLADEDVWIVFEEVAARDWYLGPTSVEARRSKKAK